MPFPRKFRERLESTLQDVQRPDYLWLVYAVCGVEKDSCGWEGWVTDGVFQATTERHPSSTGDKPLPQMDDKCPRCSKQLFRTSAALRFDVSNDQRSPYGEPSKDYQVAPIKYEDN